jgi:hypothetical protein
VSEFLLDTGTFIQPFKAGYYSFDICPGYWRFLESQLRLDGASCFTIAEVVAEVKEKDDELRKWLIETVASRTLPKAESDERAVAVFQELVRWAKTEWKESCLRAAEAAAAPKKCKNKTPRSIDETVRYIDGGIAKFFEEERGRIPADPWLIAYAEVERLTVVTQEAPVAYPDTLRRGEVPSFKLKIPNVAAVRGVSTVTIFEMLRRLKVAFDCEDSVLRQDHIDGRLFHVD